MRKQSTIRQIIISYPRKALDEGTNSYFYKWIRSCKKIPADHWQRARKVTKRKVKGKKGSVISITEFDPEPISEMHTMKLVNCIKWCIRLADKELTRTPYVNWNHNRATLLAQSPQWCALLQEAKKRDLKMLGTYTGEYSQEDNWFRVALSTAVLKELAK